MEELRRHLRPGEKLLWESAPEHFPLLEGKMMPRILGEWIITTGLAAWLLYVERDNPNFGTGIVCLVLLVAAAIIAAPLMEYYNLRKQAYYLTDQRAILMTGDKTFYYMDLDRIDAVEVIRGVAESPWEAAFCKRCAGSFAGRPAIPEPTCRPLIPAARHWAWCSICPSGWTRCCT